MMNVVITTNIFSCSDFPYIYGNLIIFAYNDAKNTSSYFAGYLKVSMIYCRNYVIQNQCKLNRIVSIFSSPKVIRQQCYS